ncbi:MAG: hypothetical protein KBC64_00830 [Simkaniaceae bacterium]|nr:hypothetical protein [Simkaniaceae bacterium]
MPISPLSGPSNIGATGGPSQDPQWTDAISQLGALKASVQDPVLQDTLGRVINTLTQCQQRGLPWDASQGLPFLHLGPTLMKGVAAFIQNNLYNNTYNPTTDQAVISCLTNPEFAGTVNAQTISANTSIFEQTWDPADLSRGAKQGYFVNVVNAVQMHTQNWLSNPTNYSNAISMNAGNLSYPDSLNIINAVSQLSGVDVRPTIMKVDLTDVVGSFNAISQAVQSLYSCAISQSELSNLMDTSSQINPQFALQAFGFLVEGGIIKDGSINEMDATTLSFFKNLTMTNSDDNLTVPSSLDIQTLSAFLLKPNLDLNLTDDDRVILYDIGQPNSLIPSDYHPPAVTGPLVPSQALEQLFEDLDIPYGP